MASRRKRERYDKRSMDCWPTSGREPELLQDANRDLSYWLSERIDSRMHAREAAQAIERKSDE